jgi:hypothetical protein
MLLVDVDVWGFPQYLAKSAEIRFFRRRNLRKGLAARVVMDNGPVFGYAAGESVRGTPRLNLAQ